MLRWEAPSVLIQVSAHMKVDGSKGGFLIKMGSNRSQERRGSSGTGKGCASFPKKSSNRKPRRPAALGLCDLGQVNRLPRFGYPQNGADYTCPMRPVHGGED